MPLTAKKSALINSFVFGFSKRDWNFSRIICAKKYLFLQDKVSHLFFLSVFQAQKNSQGSMDFFFNVTRDIVNVFYAEQIFYFHFFDEEKTVCGVEKKIASRVELASLLSTLEIYIRCLTS